MLVSGSLSLGLFPDNDRNALVSNALVNASLDNALTMSIDGYIKYPASRQQSSEALVKGLLLYIYFPFS